MVFDFAVDPSPSWAVFAPCARSDILCGEASIQSFLQNHLPDEFNPPLGREPVEDTLTTGLTQAR